MPLKNGRTTAALQQILVGSVIPPGTIQSFGGGTVPQGWLICDGSAVSRTTYSALFAALGTNYGVGDGSTTFNLPDCRGRVLVGKDDMGGVAANRITTAGSGVDGLTLGAAGGAQTHTLTEAQLASHTHTQNSHNHVLNASSNSGSSYNSATNSLRTGQTATSTTFPSGTLDASTATNQNTGSGSPHNNTQPSIIANKIIKV